ncbi:filamin-A-interacting protein 1 [Austrofundulus limnaeus]|uniref:Filamin-A-interacting protein 1 n=1 Tax=Austrofundulus limnaeus TaxID=52670 RepID=A0A2I4C089_AUSLI|nr:PREDICTED: filamin-A-interacting protein 1 [Austrofundulus limnaeus]
MRSRSCTVEGPDDGHIQTTKTFIKEEEEKTPGVMKKRMKSQKEEQDRRTGGSVAPNKCQRPPEHPKSKPPDLSKKDLVQLLGVMEGEVQAREDIIRLLKSDRTGPEVLEAHYGSAVPRKALQALQRDGFLLHGSCSSDDVYETPMNELDRLEDKQRETYRRMLEQLLLAEKCHRRTVTELSNEKRKHADFMNKSDDFTNLLEQERERLKRLLEQEKAYQARKDQEHSRRLEKVRDELVKLTSFTLMLVDERQQHVEQMDQQNQKIQALSQKLQDKEQQLAAVTDAATEDEQKVLKLEAELELKQTRSSQEHENMTARLVEHESQNRQLRLRLTGLTQKIEDLEESNKVLQRSDEDLQQLREKISRGECGNSSLMAEVENLRKKVLEMEGKDEEITKTQTQCRELRTKLQDEENHSKELRLDVDKLQKKMVEMEKLEGAFSRSQSECSQLHTNLEKERRTLTDLLSEVERLKAQLKDLESSESKLEKAEMLLKDDVMKMKSFTVTLVEDKKNLSERLRQEEQKGADLRKMLKTEQGKVMEVTEKLIEESKKLLRLKSEMEVRVSALTEDNKEVKDKLAGEEEKCKKLNDELKGMKMRMKELQETASSIQDLNKVEELTLELDQLRGRLKQLEVVEGDLMKTEDEYDLLEKKFRTEQDRGNTLSKMLEEMKSQIARSKAVEKGETTSPEAELRVRCRMEEARTRELQDDVQVLKEKIHELMNKEDQLSQLQVDFSVLQQKFMEEEEKKKSMSQEVENLSRELEAAWRYSRALRPGTNGRRMVDVPLTSTAVQTDPVTESAEDDTTAGFIRKSVQEENHLMSNLRQQGLKRPAVLNRYPPASAELGMRTSSLPWMKKEAIMLTQTKGSSSLRSPEAIQRPGPPLHIRVMPDPGTSTATLEITSPRAEDFFSSTTIIPTLGLQKPRITIVPKPTAVASKTSGCGASGGLHRSKSPITITTISRTRSPEETRSSSGGLQSPVSIITVSTTPVSEACSSSSPHQTTTGGRTLIRMTSDKQPEPVRKYSGNIITTEDNKIHIHLGPQYKRPSEVCGGPVVTVRPETASETPPGTVHCSPRQPSSVKASQNKMTSSLTITPLSSAGSRPIQNMQSKPGSDVPSARASTRIPVSKTLKAGGTTVLGMSAVTSWSESQAMKIELRKSLECSSASAGGGKS